ncbi:tyrosine-type recombinase/integrase [Micromonospora taraxaci]|uniref:tyrosine-type recombinase/integrase n=1 Tax=Micromonospora taraxaci TaxID=1316803 RepID=UPI0034096EE2
MASVRKRLDGRPKPWLVRWRDEAGSERKKSFARKVDADKFRADVEHKLNTGNYIDPKAGKVTFQSYAERWRVMQPHRENTAARIKSQLHKHVYPAFGARPMAGVTASTLQAFVTALPLAPSSVRPVFGTVRAIFAAAVRDRVIGRDPTPGIKLPELPRDEIVPLTLSQVDELAAVMPPRYRAVVEFDAGTGLRQGELFGVEVDDLDLDERMLTVARQVQPTAGGGVVVCALKNKHSYRKVPLAQAMVDVARAHLAEYPPQEVEVLDTTGRKPVTRMARFLFLDGAGRPLSRTRFNAEVWAPARAAAGLPESTNHDLRHFYASALIRAGLNPKVVAARLGHADASMTLRVYAHLWPDDEDRSRQAVDDLFSARCAPPVPQLREVIGVAAA